MTRLRFSIIIATYNRLEELKELMTSFEQVDYPKEAFEILISDDGSTDGTRDYIQNSSFKLQSRYIHQENKGPGEARNHGMQVSKADYFIFIDSDCTVPSNYLAELDKELKEKQFDAFGGPDTYHPSFSDTLKAINYSMTSFLGTGGTRGSTKSVTKFYPRSFNMGIHRDVFQKIGGMSKLRHGQDMDFSMRIYEAGFKVGLIPEAKVYHKRRTNLKRFYKQIFNWGVARINLGRKYKEYWKPVHFLPFAMLWSAILILLFSLFIPFMRYFVVLGGIVALCVALLAFFQATAEYKSVKVGLLSIVTLFTQIFAYACGTTSGLWQLLLGKSESKGFSKNYYK